MWFLLLLLTAAVDAHASEPVRVGLYLQQPPTASPAILSAFREEVQRILAPPGSRLEWRGQVAEQESFHRVVVIRLNGACATALPSTSEEPARLGGTSVSEGKIQPFVEISCERVAAALSRNWQWPGESLPAGLFGRALARVAAHELVHALTGSADHDEQGLMKPAFDRLDLVRRSLPAHPASRARLERALGLGAHPAD